MPYRIDLPNPLGDTFDRLVELGALDVECRNDGIAAILPDHVEPAGIAAALGVHELLVSPAIGRDDESVWVVTPRPVRVGRVLLAPASIPAPLEAVRLADGPAFGTGLHPTTALCLEILDEMASCSEPLEMLDVGTGSGVLALAGLRLGLPRVVAIDIDREAIAAASANAQLNGLAERMRLVVGEASSLRASWRFVFANVLPAPLIDMAPTLVQRVASKGLLVLSGIPSAVVPDVQRAYRRLGMLEAGQRTRAGWTALSLRASW